MSEEKKINYNIDVKLNINLKINEKLNRVSEEQPLQQVQPLLQDGKLPEIKNNKLLKYRLSNKYPGVGLNTIYNSYGNLSIMGESKSLFKGQKKPWFTVYHIFPYNCENLIHSISMQHEWLVNPLQLTRQVLNQAKFTQNWVEL